MTWVFELELVSHAVRSPFSEICFKDVRPILSKQLSVTIDLAASNGVEVI
jgi:hypothetical protein